MASLAFLCRADVKCKPQSVTSGRCLTNWQAPAQVGCEAKSIASQSEGLLGRGKDWKNPKPARPWCSPPN